MKCPDIPTAAKLRSLGPIAAAALSALVAGAPAAPAQVDPLAAERIVGRAQVIDGDTLDIAGRRIDLVGIDAPEVQQTCGAAGAAWKCGLEARWALLNRVGRHWVTCVPAGRSAAGAQPAKCYLAGVGQHDVGAWLVAEGWALAARDGGGAYMAEEGAAQEARKGLWRGAFEAPWDWRRAQGSRAP